MTDLRQHVIIDYTNWRGERELRRIIPIAMRFENNEWHPDTQWLLEAADVEKNDVRTFAVVNIHGWYRHVPFGDVGSVK
jgi:predicted DNA-binding transcriptional regulator YafY